MSIRTRVTCWYAGALIVSLTLMAAVLHYEWMEQLRQIHSKGIAEPAWEEVFEVVLFYGVPTLIVLIVGGGWLVRRSLRPITTLTEAVERLHADSLSQHLPPTGNGDELDRLTQVFNEMTARLDQSFARVRDFTLSASHELKTPLTLMHAEIETALRSGESNGPHRDLLEDQLDEIQRLTKIVDGLAFLAKLDARRLSFARDPVRLDELVRDIFADTQVLGTPHGLLVQMNTCEAVQVRGDRGRLRQLLLNLATNAVNYNEPGGRVEFALRSAGGTAELTVTNTGPGIPPEVLPRVFDRFFRGDVSHNNTIEGCGLGLSISQSIVIGHGGTIELSSEVNGLTVARVRLPLVAAVTPLTSEAAVLPAIKRAA